MGVGATPASAAAVCHGHGTLSTGAALFWTTPQTTSFAAATLPPLPPCSFNGTLFNATCAGGTLADGTPIALRPTFPENCVPGASGQHAFFYAA
jgi:hypothetical protein